jgi:hypothetical protein
VLVGGVELSSGDVDGTDELEVDASVVELVEGDPVSCVAADVDAPRTDPAAKFVASGADVDAASLVSGSLNGPAAPVTGLVVVTTIRSGHTDVEVASV